MCIRDSFLGNPGFHVRGVLGVGPDPQNSATSDFDEIYTIYVNLTEEHNGLALESLSGHLSGYLCQGKFIKY